MFGLDLYFLAIPCCCNCLLRRFRSAHSKICRCWWSFRLSCGCCCWRRIWHFHHNLLSHYWVTVAVDDDSVIVVPPIKELPSSFHPLQLFTRQQQFYFWFRRTGGRRCSRRQIVHSLQIFIFLSNGGCSSTVLVQTGRSCLAVGRQVDRRELCHQLRSFVEVEVGRIMNRLKSVNDLQN